MRLTQLAAVVLLLTPPVVCWAGNSIVPTTTLAAETSNNTSAAPGFSSQSNGNRSSGNVSRLDVHTLLSSGLKTKVYAHLMLWFGKSNHMNVGYSSTDPAQVHRQITDMISRGIDGVIIDWYGSNTFEDQATQVVMAEAESQPGFTFAIMVDQGAIKWDSCAGCSPQQALINQLQYVEQKYFSSPAYMTDQGRPVVTNFDIDLAYSIDWNALNAALSTHPLFLFQNNSGFSHVLSGGSYSWVMPTASDYGLSYLASFYGAGISSGEQVVGAAYKGFNDSLAAWGSHRIMGQQCGQTWLKTFSEINGLYNSTKSLPALQLVTWNDYEEGTEIESGIDNCFSVSAAVSGTSLNWTPQGDEGTVDHYQLLARQLPIRPMCKQQFGRHAHLIPRSCSVVPGHCRWTVGKPQRHRGRPIRQLQQSGRALLQPGHRFELHLLPRRRYSRKWHREVHSHRIRTRRDRRQSTSPAIAPGLRYFFVYLRAARTRPRG